MKKFLCFLCLCFCLSGQASAAVDNAILDYALNTPESVSRDIEKLTKYLVKPYKNDYDKLKVIAYWIATHIAYDNYRFDNGKDFEKTNRYTYDVLQARTGVCSDFALLFRDMAVIANIKKVTYVTGLIYETDVLIKKYPPHRSVGHAWNEAVIDGRHFYIDTTWMSYLRIGHNDEKQKRKSPLKHKRELRRRGRNETEISREFNDFYFDFSPQEEVKRHKKQHWVNNQDLDSFLPRKKSSFSEKSEQKNKILQKSEIKRTPEQKKLKNTHRRQKQAQKRRYAQKSQYSVPRPSQRIAPNMFWQTPPSQKEVHLNPSQLPSQIILTEEELYSYQKNKESLLPDTTQNKPQEKTNIPPVQKTLPQSTKKAPQQPVQKPLPLPVQEPLPPPVQNPFPSIENLFPPARETLPPEPASAPLPLPPEQLLFEQELLSFETITITQTPPASSLPKDAVIAEKESLEVQENSPLPDTQENVSFLTKINHSVTEFSEKLIKNIVGFIFK